MNLGFYIIMAAQFFSSLADNALLVAAIAMLMQSNEPSWVTPYLKFFFVLSYVFLAPYVGAFADRLPKGHVMLLSNAIKLVGCLVMLFGVNPLAAYALVGLGAAAYSPAKYGILTEYLPPTKLVLANGWIEGLTVGSIILGTVLGGVLINHQVAGRLLGFDMPYFDTGVDTPAEAALCVISVVYVIAAVFNLYVPRTGAPIKHLHGSPVATLRDFYRCNARLWRDKLGQIALAVTTLFWGVGSALQFIVIVWSHSALGFDLSQASILQGVVALGIAAGAIAASVRVPLHHSIRVIPVGIAMGGAVMAMALARNVWVAVPLLVLIGALAGYFVVPMNALLQHRGHNLMGAGRSIAVQNFNENLSILTLIAIYSLLLGLGLSIYTVIVLYGLLVSGVMALVLLWFVHNRRLYRRKIDRLLSFARSEDYHHHHRFRAEHERASFRPAE